MNESPTHPDSDLEAATSAFRPWCDSLTWHTQHISQMRAAWDAALDVVKPLFSALENERDELTDSCNSYKVENAGLRNQLDDLRKKSVQESDTILREKLFLKSQLEKALRYIQEIERRTDDGAADADLTPTPKRSTKPFT